MRRDSKLSFMVLAGALQSFPRGEGFRQLNDHLPAFSKTPRLFPGGVFHWKNQNWVGLMCQISSAY